MEESAPLLTSSISKVVDAADVVAKSSRNAGAENSEIGDYCCCLLL